MTGLSRRDLNEFANSKKINPLIFVAASVFADEVTSFLTQYIITRWEWNFAIISGVRYILSIASSYDKLAVFCSPKSTGDTRGVHFLWGRGEVSKTHLNTPNDFAC